MKFVTPTYQACFRDITLNLHVKWKNTSWEDLNPVIRLVEIKNADYTYYQLFLVAFFSVFWTFLRSLTSKHILKVWMVLNFNVPVFNVCMSLRVFRLA